MNKKDIFDGIAGYENIKKELLTIKSWFENPKILENSNIVLPKGILFVGEPGNGKTLFTRKFASLLKAKIINIDGSDSTRKRENSIIIKNAFEEAKKHKFSVILIDEIGSFLHFDDDAQRLLKIMMDGIDVSSSRILVIATTNKDNDLSEALKRQGRFGSIFYFENPSKVDREQIIKLYIDRIGMNVNFDLNQLAQITYNCSCSDLTTLVNQTYLRFGPNPSLANFEYSLGMLRGEIPNSSIVEEGYMTKKHREDIIYHEIGHALISYKNRDFFEFYKIVLDGDSALCRTFPLHEGNGTDHFLASLEISLGGYAINKIRKVKLDGAGSDLEKAKKIANRMISTLGYKGVENVLVEYDPRINRPESDYSCKRVEKQANKLVKSKYKEVYKYLKRNMKLAHSLATVLEDKNELSKDEFESIVDKHFKEEK